MVLIRLEHVDLTFQIRQRPPTTFKDYVIQRVGLQPESPLMTIPALRGINLDLRDGDRLAILGHNGAGKSTLLKTVAGIYLPSAGCCATEGRISSVFDLTLGFEQDATGWENIALRCYLEGDSPQTMRDKSGAIAEFSGLGDFLNMPLRYYSSGMVVRLAFSIATAIDPEILVMDEVLAAGDVQFQEQARRRLEQMMARARIILFASHDMSALAGLCNRAIWLDQGRIRCSGSCADVIAAYTAAVPAPSRQAA